MGAYMSTPSSRAWYLSIRSVDMDISLSEFSGQTVPSVKVSVGCVHPHLSLISPYLLSHEALRTAYRTYQPHSLRQQLH